MVKLLVVGGAGYIGSTVVFRALTSTDWDVTVFDRLMYGGSSMFPFFGSMEDRFTFTAGDVRKVDLDELVKGFDLVLNCAALVGEHICKKYPEDTMEINQKATLDIAAACERNGVKRYIFASTCSNYGKTDIYVNEEAETYPLSLYAETKIFVEKELTTKFPNLACTVLRFATIYGLACRVRFDLLVHEFIRDAWNDGEIEIYGPDGWRPFLHVDDAARAVITVCDKTLQKDPVLTLKNIYNVGANDQNFQKVTLAEMIQKRTGCKLNLNYKAQDKRSYRVNFSKISDELGFKPIHSPEKSVDLLVSGLESGMITTQQLEESVNVAKDDPIRQVKARL